MSSATDMINSAPLQGALLPCSVCSRTFLPDVLSRHQRICQNTAAKRRRSFDSRTQRLQGIGIDKLEIDHIKKTIEKTPQRRAQPQLQRRASSGRGGARSQPHRSAVATTASVSADYQQCPHCTRKFGLKSADRHIEWCKNRDMRRVDDNVSAELRERMEARRKYQPPVPMSRRSRLLSDGGSGRGCESAGARLRASPDQTGIAADSVSLHSLPAGSLHRARDYAKEYRERVSQEREVRINDMRASPSRSGASIRDRDSSQQRSESPCKDRFRRSQSVRGSKGSAAGRSSVRRHQQQRNEHAAPRPRKSQSSCRQSADVGSESERCDQLVTEYEQADDRLNIRFNQRQHRSDPDPAPARMATSLASMRSPLGVEGSLSGRQRASSVHQPSRPSPPLSGDDRRPSPPLSGVDRRPSPPLSGVDRRPSPPLSGDDRRPSQPLSGDDRRPSQPLSGDDRRPSQPLSGDDRRPDTSECLQLRDSLEGLCQDTSDGPGVAGDDEAYISSSQLVELRKINDTVSRDSSYDPYAQAERQMMQLLSVGAPAPSSPACIPPSSASYVSRSPSLRDIPSSLPAHVPLTVSTPAPSSPACDPLTDFSPACVPLADSTSASSSQECVPLTDSTPSSPVCVPLIDSTPSSPECVPIIDSTPSSPECVLIDSTPSSPVCVPLIDSTPSLPACVLLVDSTPSSPTYVPLTESTPSSPACAPISFASPVPDYLLYAGSFTPCPPYVAAAADPIAEAISMLSQYAVDQLGDAPVGSDAAAPVTDTNSHPTNTGSSLGSRRHQYVDEAEEEESEERQVHDGQDEDSSSQSRQVVARPHWSRASVDDGSLTRSSDERYSGGSGSGGELPLPRSSLDASPTGSEYEAEMPDFDLIMEEARRSSQQKAASPRKARGRDLDARQMMGGGGVAELNRRNGETVRFCHECGSQYPVHTARFCCCCGTQRVGSTLQRRH